jgi:hypothetical protein
MAHLQPIARADAMPQTSSHQCQCPHCQGDTPHPDQALPRQMHGFLSRLDEPQRRWYAALEASRLGHGGDQPVARITGLDVHPIRRGRQEWSSALGERPADRVRPPGAGRPLVEKKTR